MVARESKESIKGENSLYVFNRLLRMSNETELSTWKQNQVRSFLKHDQIDEILSLTDQFGRTILDNACVAGNLRLVQHIFPAGAKMGKPHVTMAIMCSEEHLRILDYLLAHDHNLSLTKVVVGVEEDGAERIPLLNFCAQQADVKPLGVLLLHGFKTSDSITESVDDLGNTPLHLVRNETIAAQILHRSGLGILTRRNLRGQLPIDALIARYTALSSIGLTVPEGHEEGLKKSITFLNTVMSHIPRPPTNQQSERAITPPTIPGMNNMRGSQMMLNRQSSNNTSSPSHLPPRDINSFLSRGVINKVTTQNRIALLREQRELLQTEIAALQQRNQMLDMQQQEPSLKQQHQHGFRAYQQQPNNNAIDFMGAASHPSLSLLASALSKNQHNNNSINNNGINGKNTMLHQEDIDMRTATKSMIPQNRFEETQLQKLLRARYN